MKKCPSCQREIDPYGIVCEYCNEVENSRKKEGTATQPPADKPAAQRSSAFGAFWKRLTSK